MSIIDDIGVTLVAETNSNSVCIDHIEIRFTKTKRMKSTFNDRSADKKVFGLVYI